MKKDQSRFIDHHGKEALNFQLTLLIAAVVCGLLVFVFIGILLFPVLIILSLVLEIMACVAANRGEWYRYPFCIRFIR